MNSIILPNFLEAIETVRVKYPDIWGYYESEEIHLRNEILSKINLSPVKAHQIFFLRRAINSIKKQLEGTVLTSLLVMCFEDKLLTVIERSENQFWINLTRQYNDPIAEKLKPLSHEFFQRFYEELPKEDMNVHLILDILNKVIEAIPFKERIVFTQDRVYKEVKRFSKIDESATLITLVSNLIFVRFSKERIKWLEEKITFIENSTISSNPIKSKAQPSALIPIEGNLSQAQIMRAIDFFCEVPVYGSTTLMTKEEVVELKKIGLCLPENGSYEGKKFSTANFQGKKSKIYCYFHRLWEAHSPVLNSEIEIYAKFIKTYFEGFKGELESICKGMSANNSEICESKFSGYIPSRIESH